MSIKFGIAGIDMVLSLVLVILFLISGPFLLESVLNVKTEVSDFEQIAAAELDLESQEDLEFLNTTLTSQDGLKDATQDFFGILLLIFFIFSIVASFVKALEYKMLTKKRKYLKLLLWFGCANLGIFIISILYLTIATSLTSYLGFTGANAMNISLLIGLLIFSYLLMGTYTYIMKKFSLIKLLKIHSIFVVIGLVYYYLFKVVILSLEGIMSSQIGFLFSFVVVLVLVYIGHLIIVTEQDLLLK